MEWWQRIPEQINPIAFTVGFFSVHWYALCWLFGVVGAFFLAKRMRTFFAIKLSDEDVFDLFLAIFFGAYLGGHIGYGLFYRPDIFLVQPVQFFLPYTSSGGFTGISGMSFHGGLIGVIIALYFFVRKKEQDYFLLADLLCFVAPVAIFFGRIGNFMERELYGRVTQSAWGMHFPGVLGGHLRHPSALYEALGEGLLLFLFLFFLRRRCSSHGRLTAWFLIGYGSIRFFIEYFREPDRGLALVFNLLTRGQFFSLLLIFSGSVILVWLGGKNHGKIEG